MKTKWMIPMTLALMLTGLAQAQTFEDDLYYNPKTAKAESKPTTQNKTTAQKTNANVRVYDQTGTLKTYDLRNVDEYNRRPNAVLVNEELAADTLAKSDSLALDENGQPFEYSERIRRFHNPNFTKQITDDEYLSIYVEDGADVNIYYTDGSARQFMSPFYYDNYWYPSYGYGWNNWYRRGWGMYYDPWMYGGWGYSDPWYSGYYGYGFGSWYDPWWGYGGYGGCYGGYYGYYGNYYGHGGGWGYYGGSYGTLGRDAFSRNRHTLSNNQRDFISNVGSGRLSSNRATGGGTRSGSTFSAMTPGGRTTPFANSSSRSAGSTFGNRTSSTVRESLNAGSRGYYSPTTRSINSNSSTRTGGYSNQNDGTSSRQSTSGTNGTYGTSRSSAGRTDNMATTRSSTDNYGSSRSSSNEKTSQTPNTPTSSNRSSSNYGTPRTSTSGSSSSTRTATTSTRQSYSSPNTNSYTPSSSSSSSSYSPSSRSSSSSSSESNSGSSRSSGGSSSGSFGGGRR